MNEATKESRQPIVEALCLVAFGLTFLRLFYGVCFSDEAIYVAYPYRFVLGDRPFIDEWFRCQLAALFLIPIVKLYVTVVGSTEGIVLFMRIIYFFVTSAVAATAYFALGRAMSRTDRLLACSPIILFMPWCIPNLGYNAVGSLSFVTGVFLGLWHLRTSRRALLFLAGMAHAVTVVAMPNYAFAILLFLILSAARQGRNWHRHVFLYTLGGALVVLSLMPYWLPLFLGGSPMLEEAAWHVGRQPPFLTAIYDYLVSQQPIVGWAVLCWFGAAKLLRTNRARAAVGLALALVPVMWEPSLMAPSALFYIRNLALWAPLFLLSIPPFEEGRRLLQNVWLPAIVAGLFTMWGSNTYTPAAGFGALAAAIVTIYAALSLARSISQEQQNPGLLRLARVGVLGVLATLLYYQLAVYEDEPLSELTETVSSGPFRGIRTNPERHDLIFYMEKELNKIEAPGARVIFVEHFPAGYLMSAMRPAVPDMWNKNSHFDYIRRAMSKPDPGPLYVVRVHYPLPYGQETANSDEEEEEKGSEKDIQRKRRRRGVPEIDQFLRRHGERFVFNYDFEIYRMRTLDEKKPGRSNELSESGAPDRESQTPSSGT